MRKITPEEILKALETHYSESIFITDGEGNIIFVNEVGADRLNNTIDGLMGKNVKDLVEKGMYEKSTALGAIRTKKPFTGMITEGRDTLSHSVPLLDDDGKVEMVLTSNMSTARYKEWERMIAEERDRVEKLRREIDNLRTQNPISIIAKSAARRKILENADIIAPTDSNVIIEGESGTGKSVAARYIHDRSQRNSEAFVTVNCAAIPEALLESELFGYEAGAFTGALAKGKMGLFEAADGGTIFLDEIGEMPLGLQSKLLNVIEEKKIRRVGGVDSIPVDVRIICATNSDLNALVKEKKFREDLYYRLSVFTVKMLPLRETPEDIIPLAEFFLEKMNKTKGTNKYLSEAAQRSMLIHNWPGNIRELRNVVERIYVISYTDSLDFVPTPTFGLPTGMYDAERVVSVSNYGSLKEYVNEAEKLFIDQTLDECGGSMSEAARRLKIDRSALYKKYKKLCERN